jgi:hypothetical protein
MKTFKNLQEFMESNPDEKIITKVLNLVNRESLRSVRFEIMKKEGTLKKINKTETFLLEQGFRPDNSFKLRKKELETEILSLRKLLPVVKKEK